VEAAAAVNVTLPPLQNVVAPDADMVAVGNDDTETVVAGDVAEHPVAFVTLTVYEPAVVVLIDCVVCPPGVHKYDEPVFAVNVTLFPEQSVVDPEAVIVADGAAATVTTTVFVMAAQPAPLLTLA
jgi:hypothetical protein